jgi:hypothetical protein
VQQFLSNMITCPATCLKKTILRITQSLRMHAKVLAIIVTGLASSLMVTGYLARDHPTIVVLSSLLSEFAPLIGLCVLLVIVSLLISYLVCTVEQMLADEDDGIVREPHFKSKWYRITYFPSELLTYSLGLKEHSPPVFLFS